MADVFISYSRTDRPRISKIAQRLRDLGYGVWWDRDILPGTDFADAINRELDQARVVLVAWSGNTHQSIWVFAESLSGLETKRLVQICLEPIKLKIPFNAVHFADFCHDEDWAALKLAIDSKLGVQPDENAAPQAAGAHRVAAPPALKSALLIGVISTLATVGLAILVGVVTAPMLPVPALQGAFKTVGTSIDSLTSGALYAAFGAVAALASVAVALSIQRIYTQVRVGG